jgi:hypothetical protein
MKRAVAILMLLASAPALSQSSSSYQLESTAFNAGGNPNKGMVLTSATYRITLDAIGDGVVGGGLTSPSFQVDGSFAASYRPPGEVQGVQFKVKDTMRWQPEPSAGTYAVYRSALTTLPAGDTGSCFATDVVLPATPVPDLPAPGTGYFFLVTARNRLEEEGTKGYRSNGAERPNPAPCP